jgi:hypothetical protein
MSPSSSSSFVALQSSEEGDVAAIAFFFLSWNCAMLPSPSSSFCFVALRYSTTKKATTTAFFFFVMQENERRRRRRQHYFSMNLHVGITSRLWSSFKGAPKLHIGYFKATLHVGITFKVALSL